MTRTSPTLLIAAQQSRALVPFDGGPEAQQTRQRRIYWFGIDQAVNSLVMLAVIALFAGHAMLTGTQAVPGSAPAPDAHVSARVHGE